MVSGYCQTCSDTAEAWSEAKAERLQRAIDGLEAIEKRTWTVTTPLGLDLDAQSHVAISPAKGLGWINPNESMAVWAFVHHKTSTDPMPGIMAKRRARRGRGNGVP